MKCFHEMKNTRTSTGALRDLTDNQRPVEHEQGKIFYFCFSSLRRPLSFYPWWPAYTPFVLKVSYVFFASVL